MKRYKIIHLDDHKLITDGVGDYLRRNIPDIYYLGFNDSWDAFRYLVNSIEKNEPIDLFITDYAHPGLDGYHFSKAIRELENLLNREQMKILLLTMYGDTLPVIKQGLNDKAFNWYLSLNSNPTELIDCVKSGLGRN